ncbi:MAG: hypothetical protein AAB790_02750 [Patescibacteria group bacterium]
MKSKLLSAVLAAAFAVCLTVSSALAQVLPPPPPPPPPAAAADTADHGGNRWKFGTQAAVHVGACLIGNAILLTGDAARNDFLLWNAGCAVGGPVGGGAALALFQQDDGLVTNLVKGTFKCQANDKRDRCKIWVQQHPQPVKRHNKRHVRR